jgi:hypothetical protein
MEAHSIYTYINLLQMSQVKNEANTRSESRTASFDAIPSENPDK